MASSPTRTRIAPGRGGFSDRLAADGSVFIEICE